MGKARSGIPLSSAFASFPLREKGSWFQFCRCKRKQASMASFRFYDDFFLFDVTVLHRLGSSSAVCAFFVELTTNPARGEQLNDL